MPGLLKKLIFLDDFDTKNPGKSSLSVLARHLNRLGVVELVGREQGALDLRESREQRVTKFSPKNNRKRQNFQTKNWIRNNSFQ
jgi:hypothetical protein